MRREPEHPLVARLFADILDYPAPGIAGKAAQCAALLDELAPQAAELLSDFCSFAEETPLGKLEEIYSGFFDLNPVCHPYVGYQLFGENYKRSTFLLGLKERYRAEGFESDAAELPDRLSIVLRYLARSGSGDEAGELVREGLLPALRRMTARPESGDGDPHGAADFDGDTGIDRRQLDGHSHGEVLGGGFVLETGNPDDPGSERLPHPYHRALQALRIALRAAWQA